MGREQADLCIRQVILNLFQDPGLHFVDTGRLELMNLVGVGRIELPTLTGYASETYAYTSSATRPLN